MQAFFYRSSPIIPAEDGKIADFVEGRSSRCTRATQGRIEKVVVCGELVELL